MAQTRINLPSGPIAEFCVRHGIRRLSLFGSALHSDFRSDSDVDVLVEFFPEIRIGLIGIAAMQRELSELIAYPAFIRPNCKSFVCSVDEVWIGSESG